MRKPIIGGNWKMNRGAPAEAKEMLEKLIPLVKHIDNVDVVVCPPFTALTTSIEFVKGTNVIAIPPFNLISLLSFYSWYSYKDNMQSPCQISEPPLSPENFGFRATRSRIFMLSNCQFDISLR